MATDFAMPVQQLTTSPAQYGRFSSQQASPINSATATPNNPSPTSPRSVLHSHIQPQKQLRPPKSPLPPTDRPPPPAGQTIPLTPPPSKDSSFDELENARTLSRLSTAEEGKRALGVIVEAEHSSEGLARVTGLPTRAHWKVPPSSLPSVWHRGRTRAHAHHATDEKITSRRGRRVEGGTHRADNLPPQPDSESVICDDTTCPVYFGFLSRKHHCRRCGNIFCDRHSSHTIPLDQDANYHPGGAQVRACEHCFTDYLRWRIARSSRSNSESSDVPTTPTVSCAGRAAGRGSMFGGKNPGMPESLGASVPRDWNWSTF
ncbi:hypothetical protein PZA11_002320 [Diplocarpon coronariae]